MGGKQYRLRTLFILVTLFGVLFGLFCLVLEMRENARRKHNKGWRRVWKISLSGDVETHELKKLTVKLENLSKRELHGSNPRFTLYLDGQFEAWWDPDSKQAIDVPPGESVTLEFATNSLRAKGRDGDLSQNETMKILKSDRCYIRFTITDWESQSDLASTPFVLVGSNDLRINASKPKDNSKLMEGD